MPTKHRLNDNPPNITPARALELDPDMPDFALRAIAGFRPLSLTRDQWQRVNWFVAECVASMRPRTFATTRRLLTMIAGFVSWTEAATGCELTVESVFTNHNVVRYLASARIMTKSASWRWDVNRQLSIIGRRLARTSIDRLPAPQGDRSGRVFTDRQIANMHAWATSLSTDFKRRNACTVLALAAGAGLTAQEIAAVRVEDIRADGDLFIVDVTARHARSVPLLMPWRRSLRIAIGDRTEGLLFRGFRLDEYPPRTIQRFFDDNPGPLRPSVRDLRRGWVISQIEAGLPLPLLMKVGGFRSLLGLDPYLAYLKPSAFEVDLVAVATLGGAL